MLTFALCVRNTRYACHSIRDVICCAGGQMVVTDLAEPSKRVDALGKLSISYGVGMVVGPFIGGILADSVG